jgi:molybdenum-dependent DNA-binding transcriptional regulator ModE
MQHCCHVVATSQLHNTTNYNKQALYLLHLIAHEVPIKSGCKEADVSKHRYAASQLQKVQRLQQLPVEHH